jgi:prepilin-type N-terminal cleavage/methylation domain-containing protein
MNFFRSTYAFTLIELMITVVIVGMLALVAIPSYQRYVTQAKLAEAYTIIDSIKTSEISYFMDASSGVANNEFFYLAPNPVTLNYPLTLTNYGGTSLMAGLPIGSNVHFSYRTPMGKTDAAGAELSNSPLTGLPTFQRVGDSGALSGRSTSPSFTCNPGVTAASYGVTTQPNYDWILIAGIGDLNGNADTSCTTVFKMIDVSNSTNRVPSQRAFVIVNLGD